MRQLVNKIISLLLCVALLFSFIPSFSLKADAASRYALASHNISGNQILEEARKWANTGATYWSGTTPWLASIYWRTGYTYEGQTSFDCSGFVGRILNDCGFRSSNYTPSYGNSILSQQYGAGYIAISIEELVNYGTDITTAVQKAKNGDYSLLLPGDIIGWVNNGRHVIIYAGMKNSSPWMIEFTGSGYLEREIPSSYQSKFENGARFACENSYFDKCTFYPSHCLIQVTSNTTYVKSLPCSEATDSNSKNVETAAKADYYTSIGLYKNSAGNLWYKVEAKNGDIGYIYSGDTVFIAQEEDDVTISGAVAPTVLAQGSSFAIKGTVKTKYQRLTAVGAFAAKASNNQILTGESFSVDTTSYKLDNSQVDSALKFGSLATGDYVYFVVVTAKSYYAKSAKELATVSDSNLFVHYSEFKVVDEMYSITLQANGGSCNTSSMTVAKGCSIGTLPTPSFASMNFAGWYTAPVGGNKVTANTVPTGDMVLWAHYSYPNSKLSLNTNGGSIPGAVLSDTIDGVNRGRPGETLVVFNKSGTQPGTNIYGKEIAVNSSGKITGIREYGDETQLTVPNGGFILSGQQGWDSSAGVSTGGAMFVKQIIAMDEAYVSLNYETGEIKVFDSYAGYLAETKRLQSNDTYGALPVPTKNGYVFKGWRDSDWSLAGYNKSYSGATLNAVWEKEGSLTPSSMMEYNGHYYELFDHNVTWLQAKALCEARGGYLVSITSASEQAAVKGLVEYSTRGMYKIGATDSAKEGTWNWVSGEAFSYSNWDSSLPEPSGKSGENYAVIIAIENAPNKQVGEWIDDYNISYGGFYDNSNSGFICEMNAKPSTSIKVQPTTQKVKAGTKATFSVEAEGSNLSYQWQYKTSSSGTWKNCTAEGNQTATLKVSATTGKSGYYYRCKISDNSGNTIYTNVVRLYVLGIKTQPTTQKVKAGTTATFTVSATGANKTYQWQYKTSSDGNWLSCTAEGNKTATLKVSATTGKSSYYYRCQIKDNGGNTIYTNVARLYVLGVKTQPTTQKVKAGTTATFKVSATGLNKTYQWQYKTSADGEWKNCTATGNKTATLKVSATTGKSGYYYRCVIKDDGGNTVYTNAVRLYVLGITTQPTAKTAKAGTTVKFTVAATGAGKTYQWQYKTLAGEWKNTTATGAKTATLSVSVTAAKNGYQYRCIVKDNAGNSVTSNAAKLTVK